MTTPRSRDLPVGAREMDARDVRATQLRVLEEFAQLCTERGYRWWLCAGTLLGAVRHGGYIPWDDDVDVAMPREDFERFCSDPRGVGAGRALASLGSDESYCFPYAKLYDANTRVLEHYRPRPTYGVGVDVFPVDTWPDGAVARRVLSLGLVLLRGMLGVRIVEPHTLAGTRRQWVARAGRVVLTPLPPRVFAVLLTGLVVRVGRLGRRDRGVIVWGYEEKVPAEAFADDVSLDFEGTPRPAPRGWSQWLTAAYGDYLTPPPEAGRGGHPHLSAHRF